MPARSSILLTLPEDVRHQVDAAIIDAGFGGYSKLSRWLGARGHAISVSALQRYGAQLRREVAPEIQRLRVSCARTTMLRATLAEHGVELPDALAVILQEQIHQAVEEGADAERLGGLERAARTLHTTVRTQEAMASERRAAAERAEREAKGRRDPKRRGLSPEGQRAIRDAIEGGAQ